MKHKKGIDLMRKNLQKAALFALTFSLITACGTTTPSVPQTQSAKISVLFPESQAKVTRYLQSTFPDQVGHFASAESPVLVVDVSQHSIEDIQNNSVFQAALQKKRSIILDSDGTEDSKNKIALLTQQVFGFEMRSSAVQISPENEGGYGVVALAEGSEVQKLSSNSPSSFEVFALESDLVTSNQAVDHADDNNVSAQLARGNDGELRWWPINNTTRSNEIHTRGAIFFADNNWSTSTYIKSDFLGKKIIMKMSTWLDTECLDQAASCR